MLANLGDRAGGGSDDRVPIPVLFFLNAAGAVRDQFDAPTMLCADAGPAEGLAYFIETIDGRTFKGRIDAGRELPRVGIYGEDQYTVLWGDEAVAMMKKGR